MSATGRFAWMPVTRIGPPRWRRRSAPSDHGRAAPSGHRLERVSTTRVTRHIRAPRSRVYKALIDPDAVQQWMVPDQMTSRIHAFDAREGGAFRISLTYDVPTAAGKTDAQ